MYKRIKEHPTTGALWQHLEDEGLIDKGEADQMVQVFRAYLDSEYEAATGYKPNKADWRRPMGRHATRQRRRRGAVKPVSS